MNLAFAGDREFVSRITEIILANLGDEDFGVKQLALEAGLSPSSINRRLQKINRKTIKQFIRETRLQEAMKMLQQGELTASEIAFRVGFSSPAYFTTCFHEFYGFPPGEARKMAMMSQDENNGAGTGHIQENPIPSGRDNEKPLPGRKRQRVMLLASLGITVLAVMALLVYFFFFSSSNEASGIRSDKKMKSIAVLPFADFSPEKDQEYFCDGISEELINALTLMPELKVIARTSAFSFKDKQIDAREIGKQLEVKTILEGSVRKSGNRVRISAQLIDVNNGYHLWTRTFDRELKDIFAIQDEITDAIVDALKAKLIDENGRTAERKQTKNAEAYELYLKGRFFCYQRSEESMKNSIGYFERAIAVDPDYALAYAGLADILFLQTWWGWNERPGGYEKAKESAMRALDLDPELAEAYATLGMILCYNEWKWEESRKMLKRAIELNPNSATAHHYHSELLSILCEYDRAHEEITLAIELDPVFFLYHFLNSLYYMREARYEEALEAMSKAKELNPDHILTFDQFFTIYFYMGNDSMAVETLQKKFMMEDALTMQYANTVWDVYHNNGMKGIMNLLNEIWRIKALPTYVNFAGYYCILKEKEKALTFLEKAMEEHNPSIPEINADAVYDILRAEPRFLALINQMGLAPYHRLPPR